MKELSVSVFLVFIASLCAFGALMAVVFEISDPKVYPGAIAASLMFGWASMFVK